MAGSANCFDILISILLPPLGVFLKFGCGHEFWICLLLTFLGYIPGIIYAVYAITKQPWLHSVCVSQTSYKTSPSSPIHRALTPTAFSFAAELGFLAMTSVRGKVKLQCIVDRNARQATFRKRRATLIEKASELAGLCDVLVAAVVYGQGEAEPTVWPSVPEATAILQRYVDLPDSFKETSTLDYEGFVSKRVEKLTKKAVDEEAASLDGEVNLILNDVGLGRRQDLGDLSPEFADHVMSVLELRMMVVANCINFLISEATPAPPPPQAAMAPMLADLPLLLPPPPQEPPLAMAALMEADLQLLMPAVEPQAAGACMGGNAPMGLDGGEPRNGSYVLEMADAIVDDGTGVQATAEDVDRILTEHGLFNFKPM